MKRRILVRTGLGLIVATAIAGSMVAARRVRPPEKKDEAPLALVKRGDMELRVHATGELSAANSAMLIAPPIGGDSLQITTLLRTGTVVKKGDVVIEFDPSEQRYKLEQNHSELMQAEQEIAKAKADAVVLAAQDKVALLKARFGVRHAELDVQKNELLSKIDADKNLLALDQAKRILAETEKDLDSHKQAGQAAIYLAEEKAHKSKLAMEQAQENLNKMIVTAPMDGVVSVQRNMNAAGGFYFSGMTLPDFHAGDQAQPGSAIAKVVDPAGMNLTCRVGENDHENVKQGRPVEVIFDALPGRVFHGTVKSMSGMSMRQFFEAASGGSFDVTIQLAENDPALRSGFTAEILFLGETRKNVLYIPRQALFIKDGKRIVYVKKGGGFEQREIEIENQNESRAEVKGLNEGEHVALIDPTAPRKASDGAGASATTGGAL